MKNRFYAESFHRELSKSDQRLLKNDAESEAQERIGNTAKELAELQMVFNGVIYKYFPKDFVSFDEPNAQRIEGNYAFMQSLFSQFEDSVLEKEDAGFDRSLIVSAAVRHIDDFIDRTLWPRLEREFANGTLEPDFEKKFDAFMREVYVVGKDYDPYTPEEIIELPLLEVRLTLHPDQKTFDDNIENYVFYKSFNGSYLEHILKRERSAESSQWSEDERNKYLLLAVWDIARDLHAIEPTTDFDVFRHIQSHHLNPQRFIDFIWDILRKNAPTVDAVFKSRQDLARAAFEAKRYDPEFSAAFTKDADNSQLPIALADCLNIIETLQGNS